MLKKKINFSDWVGLGVGTWKGWKLGKKRMKEIAIFSNVRGTYKSMILSQFVNWRQILKDVLEGCLPIDSR